jgi:DNA repair exonuclease SbcCD nuclease subunit
MIKILLTSDIHLGVSSDKMPVFTPDRIFTFKKISSLAKDHDLLLIAGDLFDSMSPDDQILSEVTKLFAYLRKNGTTILLSPGEHEYDGSRQGSFLYRIGADRIFDGNLLDPFEFVKGDDKVYVYGSPAKGNTSIFDIGKNSSEGFHIGLFHTDITGGEPSGEEPGVNSLPIQKLKSLELDFYALGHNHFFKLYKYQNEIIGAYPGSPEAVGADETGDRYVLSLTIDNGELTQIKRLTVNSVNVINIEADCSAHDPSSLMKLIKDHESEKNIMTLTLTGERNFQLPWESTNEIAEGFRHIEIRDRSNCSLKVLIDNYSSDNSIRGEFFSKLKQEIDSGASSVDEKELSRILAIISCNETNLPEDWLCALIHA